MSELLLGRNQTQVLRGGLIMYESSSKIIPSTSQSSINQISAITCAADVGNNLATTSSLSGYFTLTLTSASGIMIPSKANIIYYTASAFLENKFDESIHFRPSSSNVATNYNIYVPLLRNDNKASVAQKTYDKITGSLGYLQFFSASLSSDKIIFTNNFSCSVYPPFVSASGFGHNVIQSGSFGSGSGRINYKAPRGTVPQDSGSLVITRDANDTEQSSFIIKVQSSSFGGTEDRNVLYVSASVGKIGIGTTDPQSDVDIVADSFKIRSKDGTKVTTITSGSPSISENLTVPGLLTVGRLEATEITSSIVSSSIIYSSGSNIFGDASTDTHLFNGDITASGNISASDEVQANTFGLTTGDVTLKGDAINLNTDTGNSVKIQQGVTTTVTIGPGNGNITASGNISASGTNHFFGANVEISSGTGGDATLTLSADTDNNVETDNPYMIFEQDGGGVTAMIGLTGDNNKHPDETSFLDPGLPGAGYTNNSLVIAQTESAENDRRIILVSGGTASLLVTSSGGVLFPYNQWTLGSITSSGDISASNTVHGFTGSFSYITASKVEVDGDTFTIGGEAINKTLVQNLKDGFDSSARSSGGAQFKSHITMSGCISQSEENGTNVFGSDLEVFGRVRVHGSEITIENGHISMSGNISGSAGTTGSFAHIITSGETIEFKDGETKLGDLKFNARGMEVKNEAGGKGETLTGNITASGIISASGDIMTSANIMGSNIGSIYEDYIYLTPTDFDHLGDKVGVTVAGEIENTGGYIADNGARGAYYCQKIIPKGHRAIAVMLKGSSASDEFRTYSSSYDVNTAALVDGTAGNPNTEKTLATKINGGGGTYCSILWASRGNTDLYGGYIKLERS